MIINCKEFEDLMIFYIDNELQISMRQSFEAHMSVCKSCAAKYKIFKKIIEDMRNSYKNELQPQIYEENNNLNNLSAYLDNELDASDSIKVKKMIITKPNYRKKFEKLYRTHKLLSDSFKKIKLREDYSKFIVKKIKLDNLYSENKNIFIGLVSFLSLSLIWIFILFITTIV